MKQPDGARLLSMSAFEAAQILRSYRRKNETYSNEQIVEIARTIRSDFYPNDYEAGVELERLIPRHIDGETVLSFCRAAVEAFIEDQEPLWVRLAPSGRDHVLRGVGPNGVQCFRNAGLLESPPSQEVSDWWDALAAKVRNELDADLLARGREAERLSLKHERERLAKLGIDREPQWIAIEDNSRGFDILSYDLGPVEPINRLIEVKSSKRTPPRIIITRSEWDHALQYGKAYVFHIWSLPSPKVIEVTVSQMSKNIPEDHGLGAWLDIEVTIPCPQNTTNPSDDGLF